MKITDFYQQKFNSDPYELLDDAYSELAAIASDAGINWNECAPEIQLTQTRGTSEKFTKYTGHAPAVTNPKLRGKTEIYSRQETTPDGINYPFVNFVVKGADAGVWSGIQYLWSEFRRFIESSTGTTVPISKTEIERKKRAEQKRKEREWQARITELMNSQRRSADLQEYLEFMAAFSSAPIEDGSHPYAIEKGIGSIFSHCNVRRVTTWVRDRTGCKLIKRECMAIPLSRLDNGRIVGWQRINSDGGKYQTRAIDSGDFSGSCHVIGKLRGAKRVCVGEGFATGSSVFMAAKKRFDAVIVAISANNVIKVIEQLIALYPGLEIWCALDNDIESASAGKGNTGLKVGIDVMKRYPNVRCTRPLFVDGQLNPAGKIPNDFNDLASISGIAEANRQIFANENRVKISANP